METTYVTQLLRGTESGRYLALDLGSTNFRSVSTIYYTDRYLKSLDTIYECLG